MFRRFGLLIVAAGILVAPVIACAQVQLLGPTPYLSFADSPFRGQTFSAFYLEDFEDGALNTPGVVAISNTPGTNLGVIAPGFFTDSVDGDDGRIDGLGRDGHSFADVGNRPTDDLGYTFRFDAQALGGLPTHVGIVWTDGSTSAPTQLEVYGPTNVLLGTIGPVKISDNSFAGETAEDRFFGAINNMGISSIVIRSPGGGNNMEVDHLQYGRAGLVAATPEPGPLALLAGCLLPASLALRRRRRAP